VVAAVKAEVGDGATLFAILHQIALNEAAKDADRIAAARELLDRRYGKAPAFGMIHTEGGSPAQAQLDAAITAMLQEMRGDPPDVDGAATRADSEPA
jgi:hypothetical protein